LSFAAWKQVTSVFLLVAWIDDTIEKEYEWCSNETINAMSGSRRRSCIIVMVQSASITAPSQPHHR
jgi:hypothetical protein